ncbi:hypothetical protein NQ314_000793 [Rhamnusium bicolor]|uniref:Translational activator of cytochrome c oxidase 1 n=1 Tax=Rhamnusium bicolor TaxID=1586634 RepID=A0AAV8ZWY9_9CUCU|nr:hypothetical protein NQ314_000793 [Rhamnusium bicolor]
MLKNITKAIPKLCQKYFDNSLVAKRSAGHSKWQNIKHIKGAKDAQRSLLFTKLSRQMKVAVQEGSSADPKSNLRLEQVIEQAKRANMPVATIQSILKSCQQDKSQAKSHLIDIKSKFGDGGGMHLFEEKGIIEAESTGETSNEEEMLEKATEHAIESGAEDVKIVEGNLVQFVCGKFNLLKVVSNLEQLKYKVTSASVEYIPLKLQNLQERDLALCHSLYQKLENMPEVMILSDNIA